MKKIVGYILVLLLAVSSCFAYTGCQKNTSESQVYKVYYMNSSANKLVEKTYKTETSDTLVLMRELMQQMNTRQKKEDCEVIKPEQVRLDHVTFDSSKSTVISPRYSPAVKFLTSCPLE